MYLCRKKHISFKDIDYFILKRIFVKICLLLVKKYHAKLEVKRLKNKIQLL